MTDWDAVAKNARRNQAAGPQLATDWDAVASTARQQERAQANARNVPRDDFGRPLEMFDPTAGRPFDAGEALQQSAQQVGDFAGGAVTGAAEGVGLVGSAGGMLGSGFAEPSAMSSPERTQMFQENVNAMEQRMGRDLSMQERSDILQATQEPPTLRPGPSAATEYGKLAGEAALLAVPETAALRAIPALTRGPKAIQGLVNAAREEAGTGSFGSAVGRLMPPTMGATAGAEAAGAVTDDNVLAQLAGGGVGAVGPALATTVGGAVRSAGGRFLNTSRHKEQNLAMARELFVKQLGGDKNAKRALEELENVERIFGPDTGILLGQASGGVAGGPAASRTRSLTQADPDFYETVRDAGERAQDGVVRYIDQRIPQGDVAATQKRAEMWAQEQLAPLRFEMEAAEREMGDALGALPGPQRTVGEQVSRKAAATRTKAYEGFQNQATQYYNEVEQFGGLEIPLGPIDRQAQLVTGAITEAEMDAMGNNLPAPIQTIAKWAQAGRESVPLSEIEGLKRAINGELRRPNIGGNEKYVLQRIRGGLDDALEQVAASGDFAGSPVGSREAVQAFRKADAYYRSGREIFDARGSEMEKLASGMTAPDNYLAGRVESPQAQRTFLAEMDWLKTNGQGEEASAMEAQMEEYLLHSARFRTAWDAPADTASKRFARDKRFAEWMDSHDTLLTQRYSEMGVRLSDVDQRALAFDKAAEDFGVTQAGIERHLATQILKTTPEDVVRTIMHPRAGLNADQAIADLKNVIGDDMTAQAGVRRGIYDYITRGAIEPVTRGGADVGSVEPMLEISNTVNKRLLEPGVQRLMRAFYTDSEVDELTKAFQLAQLANRKLLGGTTRPASDADVAEFKEATGLGATILHTMGPTDILGKYAGDTKSGLVNWARGTSPKEVLSLFEEGFVNPHMARTLILGDGMTPAQWESVLVKTSAKLGKRIRRTPAAAAAAAVATSDQNSRRIDTPLPEDERPAAQ